MWIFTDIRQMRAAQESIAKDFGVIKTMLADSNAINTKRNELLSELVGLLRTKIDPITGIAMVPGPKTTH